MPCIALLAGASLSFFFFLSFPLSLSHSYTHTTHTPHVSHTHIYMYVFCVCMRTCFDLLMIFKFIRYQEISFFHLSVDFFSRMVSFSFCYTSFSLLLSLCFSFPSASFPFPPLFFATGNDVVCLHCVSGAFLVPYFSVLIFGAMPVFFMELCLGQFHRQGPITVWKMAPMFKGIC